MTALLRYGGVPVPYTAGWTAEEGLSFGNCPYSRRVALVQRQARGEGKPQFGKPHAVRQRQVIAMGLCDLCARSLKASTKVSLSHARVRYDGARRGEPAIMQVEPLLHRRCAAESVRFCPSLKRDVRDGSLIIRQVTAYEVQFAIMDEVYCLQVAGEARTAVGHAKVVLKRWVDQDADWLER